MAGRQLLYDMGKHAFYDKAMINPALGDYPVVTPRHGDEYVLRIGNLMQAMLLDCPMNIQLDCVAPDTITITFIDAGKVFLDKVEG